jgi:CMP-N,N'-diacetyllegionaminic acid synthase
MNIVALIPARSGSKEIIDKNIKLYKGIPLIAHSIKIGIDCQYINDVYVSTDSLEYQKIALEYGAKVTPLRCAEISGDLSPDIDTFIFFLEWLEKENIKIPDIIIHLRPTYPNRNILVLNDCIEKFIKKYENYDSLRTVINIKKTPYKMYYIENNILIPYIKDHSLFKEPFNQARQNFPETYLHNGCIDIIKTEIILRDGLLSGKNIYPYLMNDDEINDIDDMTDFINAEKK